VNDLKLVDCRYFLESIAGVREVDVFGDEYSIHTAVERVAQKTRLKFPAGKVML
jgi:hypothetical protein